MPPRKRTPAPPKPAHRKALERDLERITLEDREALVDLARALADDLDRPAKACDECGGRAGPDPRIVLRYADVLEALGLGTVPAVPRLDPFQQMMLRFNRDRAPQASHAPQP